VKPARPGTPVRRRLVVVRTAAAALVCAVCAVRAEARVHRYGDIEISEVDIPSANSWHGYAAYRYTIVNRSTSAGHTVELRLPAEMHWPCAYVSTTTTVAPGATADVTLYQPPLNVEGNDVGVAIDGEEERPMPLGLVAHARHDYHQITLLATRTHAESLRRANARGMGHELEVEQPPVGVARWATHWLAYSRYDAVVVSGSDCAAMGPGVREALTRYVACGGTLVVFGPMDPPDDWFRLGRHPDDMTRCAVGFGMCFIVPGDSAGLSQRSLEVMLRTWHGEMPKRSASMSVREANRALPVVEDLGVPAGGMFVVMLLFVIAAGPVNLLVLSKLGRRVWMLWTVPAVALVTCLAVFLYALLAEGWSGHTRTAAVTILDQRNHRAATIGLAGFYSPLTPGDGLHFSRDTEAVPQWGDMHDYRGRRGTPEAHWSQDQHLRGGWISARVPVHFRLRKAETRRERLDVAAAPDGTVIVVNGLGARIRRLHLADANGRIHEATDVKPGAQAVLKATSQRTRLDRAATLSSLQTMLVNGPVYTLKGLADSQGDFLLPSTYVAELDGAPFVESALAGAEDEESRSVVYGILGGGGGR